MSNAAQSQMDQAHVLCHSLYWVGLISNDTRYLSKELTKTTFHYKAETRFGLPGRRRGVVCVSTNGKGGGERYRSKRIPRSWVLIRSRQTHQSRTRMSTSQIPSTMQALVQHDTVCIFSCTMGGLNPDNASQGTQSRYQANSSADTRQERGPDQGGLRGAESHRCARPSYPRFSSEYLRTFSRSDCKLSDSGMAPPNAILGFDLAGTVVALGSDIANSKVKAGDLVAGMVLGGSVPDKGAFAGTSPPSIFSRLTY
jgi:hypothetical protein